MLLDTLAYTKALEAAGVERRLAEGHAEALVKHVLPQLATSGDLNRALHQLERRMTLRTYYVAGGFAAAYVAGSFAAVMAFALHWH